ncbi:MAG TPA: cytochrome c-type biogenesis protein [Caldimonas sp.]|nr:cytochrome c-type biogenesis protein [Caldimonas sp.]
MKRWRGLTALAAWLVAVAAPTALALEAPSRAADPVLEAHLHRLAGELRCLACGAETIADSHAAIADDLRAQMRAMLRAGANDDEVRHFITSRYPDVVLGRPARHARVAALWAALAATVLVLGATVRRRIRSPRERFEPDPEHLAHESIS